MSSIFIEKNPNNYPIGKMLTSIRAVVGFVWAAGAPAMNIKHRRGWHYIVVNSIPPPLRLQTMLKGTFPISDRR